jgi:hypothetical protein
VRQKLEDEVPGAELRGPVPLLEAVEDGADGVGGFRLISGTLSDSAEGGFTRSVITSGRAPLTPGSKAVVAAMLEKEGATLLFETLASPTSDVSISITAYYEALVKGYNARVSADMETVYEHFSKTSLQDEKDEERDFFSKKKKVRKSEIREMTDELVRSGDIKVEVIDRTQSLEMDATAMKEILDIITLKITDLMFDVESGWAAAPPKEQQAVAEKVPGCLSCDLRKGLVEGGAMVLGGPYVAAAKLGFDAVSEALTDDYVSIDQYALKTRSDIQRNSFSINLNQSTTIRVPVSSSGNLNGVYADYEDDPRYFRIVNLADPAFQKRNVQFQVDGNYIDSFQDTINFVSVNFRKSYPDQPTMTESLVFTHEDIANGRTTRGVEFPRLGLPEDDWQDYEYQVRWSVRDRPTMSVPHDEETWIKSGDPAVSLAPPFEKRMIEVEMDLDGLLEQEIVSAALEFATPLGGKSKLQRKATFRYMDAEPIRTVSVYHDRDAPVGWRVVWQKRSGPIYSEARGLETDHLYLVPPETPADDDESE